MVIITIDLEGVLVPEFWQEFAKKTNISELNRTTRDEPNYDKLMQYRLDIVHQHNIKFSDIFSTIEQIEPLPNALDFLTRLRQKYQVIILSDTFEEFAYPVMQKLGYPTLFCHQLKIEDGFITGYKLRQSNQKARAVKALQSINYKVIAIGDSYNDIEMLISANYGNLIFAPEVMKQEYPHIPSFDDYSSLLGHINQLDLN